MRTGKEVGDASSIVAELLEKALVAASHFRCDPGAGAGAMMIRDSGPAFPRRFFVVELELHRLPDHPAANPYGRSSGTAAGGGQPGSPYHADDGLELWRLDARHP